MEALRLELPMEVSSEFLGFHSSSVQVAILLGYYAASLGDQFQTF